MKKASVSLQELRRKIYINAKVDKQWRFWGMYCHVTKLEVLREAYRLAKANQGAPGIDGKGFEEIETQGLDGFLEGTRQEVLHRTYRPMPNRRVEIPKGNGKSRRLGIPPDDKGPGGPGSPEAHSGTDLRGRLSRLFLRLPAW